MFEHDIYLDQNVKAIVQPFAVGVKLLVELVRPIGEFGLGGFDSVQEFGGPVDDGIVSSRPGNALDHLGLDLRGPAFQSALQVLERVGGFLKLDSFALVPLYI